LFVEGWAVVIQSGRGSPVASEYNVSGAISTSSPQVRTPRDLSGNPFFANADIKNKGLAVHEIPKKGLFGWVSRSVSEN
jgi:hypothetical protein